MHFETFYELICRRLVEDSEVTRCRGNTIQKQGRGYLDSTPEEGCRVMGGELHFGAVQAFIVSLRSITGIYAALGT